VDNDRFLPVLLETTEQLSNKTTKQQINITTEQQMLLTT
jgi:hypothetical protein